MPGLKHLTDNELISLLKDSNHGAFTEIYHRYFELIYTHVHKKLMDEYQAKDVVQNLFAGLWFKRESELRINDLAAYLFASARNKIFDIYAHEQVQQKHFDSLQEFISRNKSIPTDQLTRERNFQAYIDQQIETLPPKMRVIFEMSRKQQLSYKEISEQLKVSENNVSKQVNNALRLLRTKLNLIILGGIMLYSGYQTIENLRGPTNQTFYYRLSIGYGRNATGPTDHAAWRPGDDQDHQG